MIKLVFPITSLLVVYRMNRIEEVYKEVKDSQKFKNEIGQFMYAKLGLIIITTIISQLLLSNSPEVEDAMRDHEENVELDFRERFFSLLTDYNYLLFIFAPLFSITMISSSDNHLLELLQPFTFSEVYKTFNFN